MQSFFAALCKNDVVAGSSDFDRWRANGTHVGGVLSSITLPVAVLTKSGENQQEIQIHYRTVHSSRGGCSVNNDHSLCKLKVGVLCCCFYTVL